MDRVWNSSNILILTIFLALSIIPTLIAGKSAMAAKTIKIEVLNPLGERKDPTVLPSRPRPADLTGKRIGILNNTKTGADFLQPHYEKALEEKFPAVKIKSWRLPYIFIDLAINRKTLKEVAENSDVVLVLVGD